MTFQEIFKEEGLYVAEGFASGYCFKISKDKSLISYQYANPNDLTPTMLMPIIYAGLFDKNYKRVYTMKQLFEANEKAN